MRTLAVMLVCAGCVDGVGESDAYIAGTPEDLNSRISVPIVETPETPEAPECTAEFGACPDSPIVDTLVRDTRRFDDPAEVSDVPTRVVTRRFGDAAEVSDAYDVPTRVVTRRFGDAAEVSDAYDVPTLVASCSATTQVAAQVGG